MRKDFTGLFGRLASHWKALLALFADAVFLAGLVLSLVSGQAHGLVLLGLVGMAVNGVKSYRLFLSDRGYFPFWWFIPTLVFPWTSLSVSARGPRGGEASEGGKTGHYRLSTTILCGLIAVLLIASSFAGPVNKNVDQVLAPLEKPGQTYLLETAKQVGIAFATARLLNGMLSLIEELELSARVGVGVAVSPGEVLEPLDDLAERFSLVMLVNLVTVSGLLLLGEVGKLIGLSLLVPLGLLVLAASLWQAPDKRSAIAGTGYRIVLLGLFLRLFVPAIGMGSVALDALILERKQAEAVEKMPEFVRERTQSLELAEESVVDGSGNPEEDSGWFFSDIFGVGTEIKDKVGEIRQDVAKLRESLPQVIQSIVEQIVIFVIKSVVLPLIFLWVILRFYRWISRSPGAGSDTERRLKELLLRERQSRGEPVSGDSSGERP